MLKDIAGMDQIVECIYFAVPQQESQDDQVKDSLSGDSHADAMTDGTDDKGATVCSDTSKETGLTNLEASTAQVCSSGAHAHTTDVLIPGSEKIDTYYTEVMEKLEMFKTEAMQKAQREKELEQEVSHLKNEVVHLKKVIEQKEDEMASYKKHTQQNEEQMRKRFEAAIADKKDVEERLRNVESQLQKLQSEELKTKVELKALREEQERNIKDLQFKLEQKIDRQYNQQLQSQLRKVESERDKAEKERDQKDKHLMAMIKQLNTFMSKFECSTQPQGFDWL
jgi:predicted ribosome quality control (RQC) complex YloA/Tae2 family protein